MRQVTSLLIDKMH